jgi:hypothetical protein
MKLALYIPIKSPFCTELLLKKGQNTPKSKGTPLHFYHIGGAYLGTLPGRLAQKGFVSA